MSTIPRREIQNKIRDIILADSFYDSLPVVIVGYLFRVHADWYPLCEIIIPTEDDIDEKTGLLIREFIGTIRLDVRVQDKPTITERKVDVPSYLELEDLINHTIRLFKDQSNITLQGLGETNVWAVRHFGLAGAITYGIDSRIRQNDYENYGEIPFRCEIQEKRQVT